MPLPTDAKAASLCGRETLVIQRSSVIIPVGLVGLVLRWCYGALTPQARRCCAAPGEREVGFSVALQAVMLYCWVLPQRPELLLAGRCHCLAQPKPTHAPHRGAPTPPP